MPTDPTAQMTPEARDAYATAQQRIGQCQASGDTRLDLFYLDLTAVPPEIGQLTALTVLNLWQNQLSALPPEIGQLTALTELYLGDNQLSTLPPEIGQLTALTELSVSNNQLSTLPPEIGKLTKLEILYLYSNALTALPPAMAQLKNLKELYLHGNDALGLPTEVLGATWEEKHQKKGTPANAQDILAHYFARKTQGERSLNEVRLVLVGRGASGKTSLVQRMLKNTFDPAQKETPGIALSEWPIQECAGDPVAAHVWDFAGQVITHSMHRYFLTHRTIYLLVLTHREDSATEDAEYWLKLIQSYGMDGGQAPPVLIALNKWNAAEVKVNRGALQEAYPFIAGFVETDCAEPALGIGSLKQALCTVLDSPEARPWVRQPYPARWWALKEKLNEVQRQQPHLDYATFLKLCEECQVTDPAAAGRDFHTLGLALNYGLDPQWKEVLADTTVLRPNWVTHHCYSLIRHAVGKEGELRQAELASILSVKRDGVEGESDPAMHLYLMKLMERFEAAYPLGETYPPEKWLIPLALPESQPPGVPDFRKAPAAEAVRLRYTYPQNLPPGLIAQFIVRTHPLMEDHHQWASGTILTLDGARGLVRALSKTVVEVTVIGGTADARRDLAGLCRDELRGLNSQITGIKVLEETEADAEGKLVWMNVAGLEKDELKGKDTSSVNTEDGTLEVVTKKELDEFGTEEARLPEIERGGMLNVIKIVADELDVVTGAKRRISRPKPRIFISYSHVDERHRKTLELHLTILKNQGVLHRVWTDRRIRAGADWDKTIQDELLHADIVLFLISPASLASSYINRFELKPALERYVTGECELVPIILEKCEWQPSFINCPPIKKQKKSEHRVPQALPTNAKPIVSFRSQSDGWHQVFLGLKQVLTDVKAKLR